MLIKKLTRLLILNVFLFLSLLLVVSQLSANPFQANLAPDCSNGSPSESVLWPPNHKFNHIDILGLTDPDGDTITTEIHCIRQDEPLNSTGDGNTEYDGAGVGTASASVRLERKGNANGRVYHISYIATDTNGAQCGGIVQVAVPHSKKKAAIDEGPLYDSVDNNQSNCDTTNINNPPVAFEQSITLDEDTTASITLTASDPDQDTLSYTFEQGPANGTLSGDAPNLIYQPNANFHGEDSFTFSVNDGQVDSDAVTLSITVLPVNDAPVAENQSITTNEDSSTSITLSGTDIDGDKLSFAVINGPSNGTLSGTAPNLSYTPNLNFNGQDSFTFKTNDGQLDSEAATVSITVLPVNDAPIAQPQSLETDEDTRLSITLGGTDIDGNSLAYFLIDQPTSGTLSGTTPNLVYTPNADFNGQDSFTFKANDGLLDSAPATIAITVLPVNDAPIANNQSLQVNEDESLHITLSGNDIDGDSLSYAITNQPTSGTLGGTVPNLTYVPNPNYHGADSFTFIANDGTLDSALATISITVNSVNDAPTVDAGADQIITEGERASLQAIANDSDGEIVTQEWKEGDQVLGNALGLSLDNLAVGEHILVITVTDNEGASASDSVKVTVEEKPNSAPVAEAQSLTTDEDTAVAIILSATDSDGDALSYEITDNPQHGVLSGTAPNLSYMPNADFNGTDAFTFKVNDGDLDSALATVSIVVNPVNDAPVAHGQSLEVDEDGSLPITLSGSDPDGDTLTYTIVSGPSNGTVTGDAPNLVYTPATNYTGNDSFTLKANDGQLDSVVGIVSITVNALNDVPVADDQSITTDEDMAVNITLSGTDPESDILIFVVQTQPVNGTLSGTAPNLTYTPNADYTGEDSFTFIVNDGQSDSNLATVFISIEEAIGEAPQIISQPLTESTLAQTYVYDVEVADNPEPVNFSFTQAPAGATIDTASGAISWSPIAEYSQGIDSSNNFCLVSGGDVSLQQSFADFAVIMDYSGSMNGEWEWVEDLIPSLEAGLLAENIGTDTPNYYGLMDASNRDLGDRILIDGQLLNTYDRFVQHANGFRGTGRESGWEGIDYVLNNYPLREGSARNFIVVTDEPEQSSSALGFTFDSMLASLEAANVTLNAVLEINIICEASGDRAIGMNGDGIGYVPDGQGGYSYCTDPQLQPSAGNIEERYVNLAFATDGAVWSISQLRQGGSRAVSFSRALQEIKVREIREQLDDAQLADLSVNNLQLTGQQLSFDLTNRGVGTSSAGSISIESSADNTSNWQEIDRVDFAALQASSTEAVSRTLVALTGNETHVRVTILPSQIETECLNDNHQATLSKIGVQAENRFGTDTQIYWLSTLSNDTTPAITSTPTSSASQNSQYLYDVNVSDNRGDDHQYSLLTNPIGMEIDQYSGVLRWRPSISQVGLHDVTIRVQDIAGNETTESYQLNIVSDGASGDGPAFSDALGTINFQANSLVTYTPEMQPSGALTLQFELLTGPEGCSLANTDTGEIACDFAADVSLIRSVFLKAEDQFGRYAIQFIVINRPPVINSSPASIEISKADKARTYSYSISDPDGDTSLIELVTPLNGATVRTNNFSWTPDPALIGQSINVSVRAVDQYGAYDIHDFVIQVVFNQDPAFTSTPRETSASGRRYTYTLSAQDPDRDSLTYNLVSGPSGMTISGRTVSWDIPVGAEGQHPVELSVTDVDGATAVQSYTLTVSENQPPAFTSTPVTTATAGRLYRYSARASDPESDSITYSLQQAPDGMTISGRTISWTPTSAQIGSQEIVAVATDSFGAASEQRFVVEVDGNLPPTITSIPALRSISLHAYTYNISATDPDRDSLSYELIDNPTGMTISGRRISWTPSNAQVGENSVAVRVNDSFGNSVTQRFTVLVTLNQSPVFTSIPITTAITEHNYSYSLRATDTDADSITYALITGPNGMTLSGSRLRWTPSSSQIGNFPVIVVARDNYGGEVTQSFTINVTQNQAPQFTTSPIEIALVGQLYRYYSSAVDPDRDGVSYELIDAPAGAVLIGRRIDWTPAADQVGLQTLRLRARDNFGAFTDQVITVNVSNSLVFVTFPDDQSTEATRSYSQSFEAREPSGASVSYRLVNGPEGLRLSGRSVFWTPRNDQLGDHVVTVEAFTVDQTVSTSWTITVERANQLPVISSTPVTTATEAQPYSYQVVATDADNEVLTYELTSNPDGMTIDTATGLINWTPAANQTTSYSVRVQVTDTRGGSTIQSYTLRVSARINTAPRFISAPPSVVLLGDLYRYQPEVVDDEGDAITYSLSRRASGMTINASTGEIFWTPSASQLGVHDIVILARDDRNASSTQEYTLRVTNAPNAVPVISSTPLTTATVGQAYNYLIAATDADGDNLLFNFIESPIGMVLNGVSGAIQWTPTIDQIGNNTVTIRVGDGRDFVEQSFVITVSEPIVINDPLAVDIVITPAIPEPGQAIQILVQAIGGTGATNVSATLDASPLSLVDGEASLSGLTSGRYTLAVSVSDDNESFIETVFFTVSEPSDADNPVAVIDDANLVNAISSPVNILGTATDNNLADYRLLYARRGTGAFVEFFRSEQSVDTDVLGKIDPTMLQNGIYDLLLEVTDLNGNTSTANTVFEVDGDFKVGEFSFTINDLEIPMLGMPVSVSRTYDTRRKQEDLDFGHGWSIDYQTMEVQENQRLGLNWVTTSSGGFIPTICIEPVGPHFVTVTRPDGKVDKFNMRLLNNCSSLIPPTTVNFTFEAAVGTDSTLVVEEQNDLRVSGGNTLLEQGLFSVFDPSVYTLTTKEGLSFRITQGQGINWVQDRGGNRITYTRDGIIHSKGKSITFTRNAEGRITRVTDPNGNTINYEYDSVGNLSRVTDRNGYTTTHTYNRSHGLREIYDPLNRRISRNIYDDAGRLIAIEDADGNRTEISTDLTSREKRVVDALGNVTLIEYDAVGNPIRETDPKGNITTRTFDAADNLLSITDPQGNTISYSYDEFNNRISETDALGNTTTKVYDANGNLLSETNALGQTMNYAYDVYNNKIGQLDANGVGSIASTNTDGSIASITDSLGFVIAYERDNFGQATAETDPLGTRLDFTFDDNGNQTLEQVEVSDGVGGTRLLSYQREFDANGNPVRLVDPEGNVEQFVYDGAGNLTQKIDKNGHKWIFEFDEYGRQTAKVNPDGSREEKVFNSLGWLVSETDRLGRTILFDYDANGRKIKTTYPDGAKTSSVYDANNRLISQTDENGNTTTFEFDAVGRRTARIDAQGNRYEMKYDAVGNVISEKDPLGRVITYNYDVGNRLIKKVFADGSEQTFAYDAMNRKVSDTNGNGGVTAYTYDGLDRLLTVTNALGNTTTYEYNDLGKFGTISFSDERGAKSAQVDALGRRTDWQIDGLNRPFSQRRPDGSLEQMTYDGNGNIVSHIDYNGDETTRIYNAFDQLIKESFSDGSNRTYQYAGKKVSRVIDSEGITNYQYDSRDRLLRVDYPNGDSINYAYDAVGNKTRIVTGSGTTDYVYDSLNRLIRVVDSNIGTTTYQYNAVGKVTRTDYPNGTYSIHTYDALDRITDVSHFNNVDGIIAKTTYTVDNNGNRTQEIDHNGIVNQFSYDALDQLTRVSKTIAGVSEITDYVYDAVGNRNSQTENGVVGNYTYNVLDQLTGDGNNLYAYDANGSLTEVNSGGNVTSLSYDKEQRLISYQSAALSEEYAYNHSGVRTSKISNGVTTQYLLDETAEHQKVIEERIDADRTRYIYGMQRIAENSASSTSYFHADGLGSTQALTNALGSLTDEYRYSPYGELETQLGTSSNEYLFAGERLDATGQYYLRARYYDPINGRLTQVDPFEGTDLLPITLHDYLYAGNNPIVNTDPSGEILSLFLRGQAATRYASIYQRVMALLRFRARGSVRSLRQQKKSKQGIWRDAKSDDQIHHVIEKRFLKDLGIKDLDATPGRVLPKEVHQIYTKRWLDELGRLRMKSYNGPYNRQQVINAAYKVYKDAPQMLNDTLRFLL